eukprot:scaffold112964_cov27-Prasinocladus_malaysianus.AAC.1
MGHLRSLQAMHSAPPLTGNTPDSAEYGVEIDYMDEDKLRKVITGSGLPDGVLQQYVRPFCDQSVIFLCTWRPHFFYVARITNEISGYTPNVSSLHIVTNPHVSSDNEYEQ